MEIPKSIQETYEIHLECSRFVRLMLRGRWPSPLMHHLGKSGCRYSLYTFRDGHLMQFIWDLNLLISCCTDSNYDISCETSNTLPLYHACGAILSFYLIIKVVVIISQYLRNFL